MSVPLDRNCSILPEWQQLWTGHHLLFRCSGRKVKATFPGRGDNVQEMSYFLRKKLPQVLDEPSSSTGNCREAPSALTRVQLWTPSAIPPSYWHKPGRPSRASRSEQERKQVEEASATPGRQIKWGGPLEVEVGSGGRTREHTHLYYMCESFNLDGLGLFKPCWACVGVAMELLFPEHI